MKTFVKKLVNLMVFGSFLSVGLFAQTNQTDKEEFSSLVKYVTSEIKEGGKSYRRSKNYVAESVISKVNVRGCEFEIEERFSQYNDFSGIDSKVSGSKEAGEVTATRRFNSYKSNFNLKDLDAALFRIKPTEEKGLVFVFLETKNEDREIKSQSGKILRFNSKKGFLIKDSASEKVLNSFKTLTKMCQSK